MQTTRARSRARFSVIAGVALAAASVGVATAIPTRGAGVAGAAVNVKKKSMCTLRTIDIAPTARNGEDFGTVSCAPAFGKGVQHNRSKLTPTSQTGGTIKGLATLYFATGTVRAPFVLTYKISGAALTYVGSAVISGGTGAYRGARGTVKLTGASSDGGTHSTFHQEVTRTQ